MAYNRELAGDPFSSDEAFINYWRYIRKRTFETAKKMKKENRIDEAIALIRECSRLQDKFFGKEGP